MSDHSRIEWTDATWNVVLGCDRVSAGCSGCYAISNARIRESHPNPKIAVPYAGLVEHRGVRLDWTGQVNLVPDRLHLPLRWTRPRKIFVTAQSDLFHSSVPDEFLVQVFAVMAVAQHHVFQVLTKRPARMRSLLSNPEFVDRVSCRAAELDRDQAGEDSGWPLANVWLGVSAEDQKWADVRLPVLLQTPAVVRFVSAEPLLGPIRLCRCDGAAYEAQRHPFLVDQGCPLHGGVRLDWVIVGGESGPNARPMQPAWPRQLRDQCQTTGVAFLFKQWGEWGPSAKSTEIGPGHRSDDLPMRRLGRRVTGRLLDDRTWDEYPSRLAARPDRAPAR